MGHWKGGGPCGSFTCVKVVNRLLFFLIHFSIGKCLRSNPTYCCIFFLSSRPWCHVRGGAVRSGLAPGAAGFPVPLIARPSPRQPILIGCSGSQPRVGWSGTVADRPWAFSCSWGLQDGRRPHRIIRRGESHQRGAGRPPPWLPLGCVHSRGFQGTRHSRYVLRRDGGKRSGEGSLGARC